MCQEAEIALAWPSGAANDPLRNITTQTVQSLVSTGAERLRSSLYALHELKESILVANGVQFWITVDPVLV
jgi:hypothetical protein